MLQMSRNRKLSRVMVCMFLGVALIVAGSAAVHAQDDDDDLPDAKFFKKMMRSIGLRNGQEAGIEYKERPPLVVPPNRDLPPPVSTDSVAVKNAAWPNDPDEKRRAAERKAKRERRITYNPETAGDALLPSQLDQRSNKPSVGTSDPDAPKEMSPSQLGFTSSMWKGMIGLKKSFTGENDVETAKFVHEPSRETLTDPPAGYRTPSAAAPYGINTKQERPNTRNSDIQSGDFGK